MVVSQTAAAAALCAVLCAPVAAGPDVTGARAAFEPRAVLDTVAQLNLWLDAYSDLPRSDTPLRLIAMIEAGTDVLYEGRMTQLDARVRGLYDAETATIYLVRPWFGDTARDQSVLLHEMAHHRQVTAQHWYCPQAMEWDAYLLQEQYLAALDQSGDFNWGWILLASSCAVRDHHPD